MYADQPYLYGPAASSVNTLHVGDKDIKDKDEVGEEGMVFEEGGSESGVEVRKAKGVPETDAARKKFFLNEENRKGWEWEAGREYGCDFYNPYLDFNDFALRLPGFTLPIMKYWDGQGLRYVFHIYSYSYAALAVELSFGMAIHVAIAFLPLPHLLFSNTILMRYHLF